MPNANCSNTKYQMPNAQIIKCQTLKYLMANGKCSTAQMPKINVNANANANANANDNDNANPNANDVTYLPTRECTSVLPATSVAYLAKKLLAAFPCFLPSCLTTSPKLPPDLSTFASKGPARNACQKAKHVKNAVASGNLGLGWTSNILRWFYLSQCEQ